MDPPNPSLENGGILQKLSDALSERGWCVLEDWLPPQLLHALRSEVLALDRDGALKKAGVGRGDAYRQLSEIRGDYIHWLDPAAAGPPQREFLSLLENLRSLLARRLLLPLRRIEAHYALYPPGAGYQRHLDRFRDNGARQVSFALYLNENWSETDGGLLRIYDESEPERLACTVIPAFGTTAVFLSGSIWHDVAPAKRKRYSLTGWIRE